MPIIETKDLKKIYIQGVVEVPALQGVDLNIDKGEFTAIVGPSGSGKTTLLNMLGGLDRPTSGLIQLDGMETGKLSSSALTDFRLRHIGFVFQAYNLIPVLSALENTEFIMMLQGMSTDDRRKRAAEVLERVGLQDMMHRRPRELSGGQQQRVAVARAIASKPRIVLADEPTANLDSTTAGELLDLMKELNAEHEITFLFSTHDDRVMKRATRIITLRDGLIDSDTTRQSAA